MDCVRSVRTKLLGEGEKLMQKSKKECCGDTVNTQKGTGMEFCGGK